MDYGLSLFKPCERAHHVKGCEEVSGGLFVSGGDTPEVSVVLKKRSTGLRYHRLDGANLQALEEGVAVIALVARDSTGLDLRRLCLGVSDVTRPTARQAEGDRQPQSIDDPMDFGDEATPGAANSLVEAPFLRAPALC